MTKESPIPQRIREALGKKGLSRGDFYQYAGINSQSIRNWNLGSIPAADTAIKMAEFLSVSVEWLVTGEDKSGLSQDERMLIDVFRLLDTRDQAEIMGIAELKLENSRKTEHDIAAKKAI